MEGLDGNTENSVPREVPEFNLNLEEFPRNITEYDSLSSDKQEVVDSMLAREQKDEAAWHRFIGKNHDLTPAQAAEEKFEAHYRRTELSTRVNNPDGLVNPLDLVESYDGQLQQDLEDAGLDETQAQARSQRVADLKILGAGEHDDMYDTFRFKDELDVATAIADENNCTIAEVYTDDDLNRKFQQETHSPEGLAMPSVGRLTPNAHYYYPPEDKQDIRTEGIYKVVTVHGAEGLSNLPGNIKESLDIQDGTVIPEVVADAAPASNPERQEDVDVLRTALAKSYSYRRGLDPANLPQEHQDTLRQSPGWIDPLNLNQENNG